MPVEINSVSHGTSCSSLRPLTSTHPKLQFLKRSSLFQTIESMAYHIFANFSSIHLCRGIWSKFAKLNFSIWKQHTNLLGVAPVPATVSTRITCLVGDSYQPSSLPGGNTQGPWDLVQEATGATRSWLGMKTEMFFFGFGDCYKHIRISAYHHKSFVNW